MAAAACVLPRSRSPVVGALGLCWLLRGHFTVFAAHFLPMSGRPPHASPRFRVREAQLLHVVSWLSTTCPPPTLPCTWGPQTNPPPPRRCDIPSGCCFFTGPWTLTRSSLRMLRWVASFCRPLRPVLLLVSFLRSQSPVVGVLGLCWMWQDVPFARQRRPVVGILGLCWLLRGSFDCFCCPHTSVLRPSTTGLAAFPCA